VRLYRSCQELEARKEVDIRQIKMKYEGTPKYQQGEEIADEV